MAQYFRDSAAGNQHGVTLLTVVMILAVMTIIGIAAISVTGLENRMAGFGRTGESAATAAESCIGTAVNVIQQTIDAGQLPATYLDSAGGPVPSLNGPTLNQEIMGQLDNHADDVNTPNTVANIGGFTVRGDIDRLYVKPKAGGATMFANAYDGMGSGLAGGGADIFYRVDCTATNAATGTTSRIAAVYACTATGDSCQK
jgi:Tfp pilus assembly protein PilX